MSMKQELLKKIADKSIVVGVCGLGYVGLPLAVEKAKAGFKTIGFDVQEAKVKMVNEGRNYIGDVVDSELAEIVESGMFKATTDFSFVKDVDFIAICVPTPLDEHQEPDISYVRNSAMEIAKFMKKFPKHLICPVLKICFSVESHYQQKRTLNFQAGPASTGEAGHRNGR